MPLSRSKVSKAERDRVVIEAVTRARNAMMLLQGTRVTFGRRSGFLNFEKEIIKLTPALQAIGLDTPTPPFQQPISQRGAALVDQGPADPRRPIVAFLKISRPELYERVWSEPWSTSLKSSACLLAYSRYRDIG